MIQQASTNIGAVIIGRNEGERLKRCLASAQKQIGMIVYVDSGSSDGSAAYAASVGASVVNLDMSIPFSAGRARNEGFKRLGELVEELKYVQFIDGDCELWPGWVDKGLYFLESNKTYAIACGRVKERYPDASVYNWLCDVEWLGAHGEVRSSGGIFLARVKAFSEIAGFDTSMVAGEEPEMCYRLRQVGWKIYALEDVMTIHDADMHHFSQWWKRTVRGGLAYAHGYYLHRNDASPHHLSENRRILFWALAIPAATLFATVLFGPFALFLLLMYPAQLLRQFLKFNRNSGDTRKAFNYSFYNTIEKFPQFFGQILFIRRRILSEKQRIIEYK